MRKMLIPMVVFGSIIVSQAQLFQANLDGLQEVPPNPSPAFGQGNFILSGHTLSVSSGSYQEVPGGATSITLNIGRPGTTGFFPVFTLRLDTPGAMSGTFSGSGVLNPVQILDLNAGDLYVNIVSPDFPGGEIRGQLEPVPEPSTIALIGVGSLGLLALRRRNV